jgi:hypothetical protein
MRLGSAPPPYTLALRRNSGADRRFSLFDRNESLVRKGYASRRRLLPLMQCVLGPLGNASYREPAMFVLPRIPRREYFGRKWSAHFEARIGGRATIR